MIVVRGMRNLALPGQREEYRQNREGKGLFTPSETEKIKERMTNLKEYSHFRSVWMQPPHSYFNEWII